MMRVHMCDMRHLITRKEKVPWLNYAKRESAMTQYKCAHPKARQMRDTPHSHVPWLVDMCHDSFTRAIWLMRTSCTLPDPMSRVTFEWRVSRMSMSHGTCGWVMAHMNQPCDMWMSHVTHHSHSNGTWHAWLSHMTHECVITRTHRWHDFFIRDINPPHVRHDSATDLTRLADASACIVWMRHWVIHEYINEWMNTYMNMAVQLYAYIYMRHWVYISSAKRVRCLRHVRNFSEISCHEWEISCHE